MDAACCPPVGGGCNGSHVQAGGGGRSSCTTRAALFSASSSSLRPCRADVAGRRAGHIRRRGAHGPMSCQPLGRRRVALRSLLQRGGRVPGRWPARRGLRRLGGGGGPGRGRGGVQRRAYGSLLDGGATTCEFMQKSDARTGSRQRDGGRARASGGRGAVISLWLSVCGSQSVGPCDGSVKSGGGGA